MSWSMESISFRMAGSGSWQNILPDEPSRRLYAEIYPGGVPLSQVDDKISQIFTYWQKAAIVKMEARRVVPIGPIMTDDDLRTLHSWFQDISEFMCEAVLERLPEYNALVSDLAGGRTLTNQEAGNILTIQICALTLDSWVFAMLRHEMIGIYPPRDFAGDFFFWGYAFKNGPQRIFGFTTYGWWRLPNIHVIRSHGLDRALIKDLLRRRDTLDYLQTLYTRLEGSVEIGSGESLNTGKEEQMLDSLRAGRIITNDDPPHLSIPVFMRSDMTLATELYQAVASEILNHIGTSVDTLKGLVDECSFAQCAWSDNLCMLFHLAYSYAADELVERGIIPDFPRSARGEWGVWLH